MNFLTCTVRGCRYRFSRRLPRHVSLYMLPRDAPDELKQGWRQVCKGRLVACSEHFTDSDFLRRKVSPEYNGKSKPLKHNVVPKMKLQVKERPQEGDSSRKQKNEEIIPLNSDDSAEKEASDPLAEDIVQEVDQSTSAIKCRITEPPKNSLKDLMYDKVVLKENGKRIPVERGPIEARIETSAASSSRSTPTSGVVVKVVAGKVPDGEKKTPNVVIKEVKLARKNFGDILARQKAESQETHTAEELLQGKDVTIRKRGREDDSRSLPEGVKHQKIDDLRISSVTATAKSPEDNEENPNKSFNYSFLESLRKGRRKQVFRPGAGSEKLIPVPPDENSLPEEEKTPEQPLEKPPENPPEKPPVTEDDDVIFLPQKIDVINVDDDDDSDGEQPRYSSTNCDPTKCKYLPKILSDNQTIISLLTQKEKLKSQRTVLQTTNHNIFTRHTASQDFLALVPRVLSDTQKNIIFGTSDAIVWQPDEIRNALVLKYLSEDLYMYLRQVLSYPLPTIESLQKWEEDYPEESVRARTAAREYEKSAEDDVEEKEEEEDEEEEEDTNLLSQVMIV